MAVIENFNGSGRTLDVTVYVFPRANMRDPNLAYELYIGTPILTNIFENFEVVPSLTDATLIFPERWCNIVEERQLFTRLLHYYPNLKKITIKTQSVYIIQTISNKCLFIVGEDFPGEDVSLDQPLFVENHGNMFNGGLTVLSSEGHPQSEDIAEVSKTTEVSKLQPAWKYSQPMSWIDQLSKRLK